ncbi:MAG: 3-phosphoshikimate 1-carboxyvinyltransferase [Bacteroidales bacterium]|nr:3-phosphoshikimate 1-carboxyvinyltransferase [Bacteroidales bacterium]
MICCSIQNMSGEEILDALYDVEMAEIRLDRCKLSKEEMEEVFAADLPLVATCRIAESSLVEAEKRLALAIEAGANYVDIEMEAPKSMVLRLRSLARESGALIIRSYHYNDSTPSRAALKEAVDKAFYHKADLVKVAAMASSKEDCETLMSLYEDYEPGRLIAFPMGEAGSDYRIECLAKGAPFTYAALGEPTAPGQLPYEEMHERIYGDFHFIVDGEAEVPSSKSFAQRAIVAAALAAGESHLRGYTPCGDSEAALAFARALGASVTVEDNVVTIKGIGAYGPASVDFPAVVDAGESGLLTRLLIPLAAVLSTHEVLITGRDTLSRRPMSGVEEIMKAFGGRVESIYNDCRVPLKVNGPLSAGRVEISGRHGSQLVSGLLMALPFLEKNTTVAVTDPKSIPYMYITLDVLKKFGVRINNEMLGGREFLESEGDWNYCTEIDFKVKGGLSLKAADIDLEGDWSAAANLLVAGAVFGGLEVEGLDTRSLQADLTVMDILMNCGATLSQFDGDTGPVLSRRAPLNAFDVDATHCPDLFPILSVLACFCTGESHIAGLDRLAHKESDRGEAILSMLDRMGVEASAENNVLSIKGESLAGRLVGGRLLKGGAYPSLGDHRMAMALKVASLGASPAITVDDEACISKSFPRFSEIWENLL